MTVYVDDMHLQPMGWFGRMKMSHMMADTEAALHAMADKIGVQRRWFQKKPSGDHYDIAISKRKRALAAGAVEITVKEMSAYAWHRRVNGTTVEPDVALQLMKQAFKSRGLEVAT